MIKTIAFDADDTLWHNETLFSVSHEKFREILSPDFDVDTVNEKLFETEVKNLQYYGYGIKGFTLSMIETALELTNNRISGDKVREIIDLSRDMLKAPVQLLEHVEKTVKQLSKDYKLMIITKGDLFDQQSKIARSGLGKCFSYIEVVHDKKPEIYLKLLEKHKIDKKQFLMVGNSLKSDILPVLDIGCKAVHIPYGITWKHERVSEEVLKTYQFDTLKHIGLLPKFLEAKS